MADQKQPQRTDEERVGHIAVRRRQPGEKSMFTKADLKQMAALGRKQLAEQSKKDAEPR